MPGYGNLLRSLNQSTDKPVEADVKGSIPNWIEGTLYRNGPGRFKFGEKFHQHLFDGGACVHKLRIQNGQVFYSNKLLDTDSYQKTLETGRLTTNFGSVDVESSIFERFQKLFKSSNQRKDNTNVNIAPYANEQLYALTETNLMCKLNAEDLSIEDTVNVTEYIHDLKTTFAHPHIEKDGSWLTMGVNHRGSNGPEFKFVRYKGGEEGAKAGNACEQAELIATLPSSYSYGYSYFHSFGLSENYIIFLEQAVMLSFKEYLIKTVIFNGPLCSALITDKNIPTRIHLINRKTGEIVDKKFVTDPQFTFHCINAYENQDEIILDLISYDADYFTTAVYSYESSYSDQLLADKSFFPLARRVKIPLNKDDKGEIYCEIKDLKSDFPFEFPGINYSKYNGLKYKYVYGANHNRLPFSVIKLNVDEPTEFYEKIYGSELEREIPSEPIFVENPEAKSEDDGVLLVLVLCEKNDYLSVLDAKDLTEVARADIPENVKSAYTFHGFFASQELLGKLNV